MHLAPPERFFDGFRLRIALGESRIDAFAVGKNGELTWRQTVPNGGKTSRDFNIDPAFFSGLQPLQYSSDCDVYLLRAAWLFILTMNPHISPAYEQLWSDPELESRIEEGIRLHRQSDAVVRVTDYDGKPLAGVKVVAEQHDSPFQFGGNLFKLGDYADDQMNRDYEDAFCAIFNGGTVPFYWRTLEPVQGHPRFAEHSVPIARRPPPDRVVKFCEERGLRMHGHTLVWNFRKWSTPDWVPTDPDQAAPFWEKRIREIGERYGEQIKRWDVLNEFVFHYERRPGGLSMRPSYAEDAFAWAEQYFPADTRFDINETTESWSNACPEYTGLIERLLEAGRRVGGIGLQFHLFADQDLYRTLAGETFTPAALLGTLDHYARLKLPVHVSEITLTAPGNTPEGLEAQAVAARNFYRLWFSHAATEGITWWNLPDGGAAQGEDKVYSGLLFEDMSPKPAYLALQDLIRREWRTRAEGVTDADGIFRFRGFHGSYLLSTANNRADSGIQSAVILEPGQTAEQTIHLL